MNKPQFEKLVTEQRKFLGSTQGVVEIKMGSPDSQTIKVLALSGDSQITSYECLLKEAVFGGRVNVKMLFSDNDGNVSCLNYNADFNEKFVDENISPDTKLTFNSVITDILPNEPAGNSVMVQCALETRIYADFRSETDCITGCDIKIKKEVVSVCEMLFSQEKSFAVIEEATTKFDIGKVLIADGKAIISSVVPDDGIVTVKGESYITITFQTASKEFETMVMQVPFSEEISAKGCSKEAVIRAGAVVKSTKLHMEVREGADNRAFTVESEVAVSLKGYRTIEREIVTDAFSLDEEINIVGESFTASFAQNYFSHFHKVDGSLQIGGISKPDQVFCGVCPKVVVLGCSAYENEIVLEGIFSGNLLYTAEEKLESTSFEVPFVVSLDCKNVSSSSQVHCEAVITDLTFKMGRNDTAEILAGIKFGFNVFEDRVGFVIKDLAVAGKKDKNYCAIETLLVKKGMTLWDMEKFLCLSGEEIMKCNPDLTLPLANDQKVTVFRQLKD